LKSAILETDISFICVGTPAKEDSSINIDAVKKVAEGIGLSLKEKTKFHVVVIKSTVVPETSKNIVLPIIEKNSGKKAGEFGLCMNPEFLREGNAVDDFLNPDRIIIGGNGKKEIDILSEF